MIKLFTLKQTIVKSYHFYQRLYYRHFLSKSKEKEQQQLEIKPEIIDLDIKEAIFIDRVIIGAGVIGLAIAQKLKDEKYGKVVVIEEEPQFGMHTSSRNSEVIHGGFYYPKGSNKEKFCIEGRHLLYEYCKKKGIKFKKLGKWIVAQNNEYEINYLNNLKNKAKELDIQLNFINKEEMKIKEPLIKGELALYSKETGILDSHHLMSNLEYEFLNTKETNLILYSTKVINIIKYPNLNNNNFYLIYLKSKLDNNYYLIKTYNIINCSGLNSDKIGNLLNNLNNLNNNNNNLNNNKFQLNLIKGNYFKYNQLLPIKRLIYPIPPPNLTSLGIHLTLDLNNNLKFGPDIEKLTSSLINYNVNELRRQSFFNSIKQYLPSIKEELLLPDYSGIRPKLFLNNNNISDFYLNVMNNGQLINLIGIESPGLTSSLALAKWVENQIIK